MGSARSTPVKWDHGLDATRLDSRVVQLSSRNELDQAVAIVTESFAGTQTTPCEGIFDYLLGPEMRSGEPLFELLAEPPKPARLTLMQWVITLLAHSRRKPLTLGVRDEGNIIAVAVIDTKLPPSFLGSIAEGYRFIRGALFAGFPPWLSGKAKKTTRLDDRLKVVQSTLEHGHHEVASQKHYYLVNLACRPAHQGKGAGGALLRALSAIADRDGLPCYLETSGETNAAIYARHGYETRKHVETMASPNAPPEEVYNHAGGLHLMVRDPGAPAHKPAAAATKVASS